MVEQTDHSPLRVLLVEDNEHDVRAIHRALGKGHVPATITHFERAEEAMERLAEGESAFDIVLTDYKLPGISGLELCKTLLADRVGLPLVILTGTGSEEVAAEALKAGVYDYLVKDPDEGYLELVPTVLAEVARKHADRVARERAEEALRRSERSLAEAQHLAHLGSFEEDIRTGEVQRSEEVYRIFGVEKEKFRPGLQGWIDTIHPEDREAVRNAIGAARDPDIEQDWYRIEYRIVRPDGAVRNLEERGEVTFDSDREPLRMRGVFLDITERKRLEERLVEARKMEAVGKLTGGVAHEFNNLLMVVIGNLDLIEEDLSADELPHALIEKARAGALRGAELTERLLAYSRKQMLSPRTVDLNDLVLRQADMLRGTLGETVTMETDVAEAPWTAHVDPVQTESAILNLVLNARDAAPPGGVITLRTRNASLDTESASAHPEGVPGDYVVLSVADTGCGMPAEVSRRAFEPFFSTKEVGQGTGLGLSMVYGFAKQSDGFAEIESEAGKGTTVMLYLPRAGVGAGAAREERGAADEQAGGGETILVVEDDSGVRHVAVTLLTSLGYEVAEAEDGASALAILDGDRPVDLLFADVVLKGAMNGPKLAAESRRRRPGLEVVYASGYGLEDLPPTEETGEEIRLIPKPYRKSELAAAIREALDRR